MQDISEYIQGFDFGTEHIALPTVISWIGDSGPLTITGYWDASEGGVAGLVVKTIGKLPRKTKKALQKYWCGLRLTARERQRLIRREMRYADGR